MPLSLASLRAVLHGVLETDRYGVRVIQDFPSTVAWTGVLPQSSHTVGACSSGTGANAQPLLPGTEQRRREVANVGWCHLAAAPQAIRRGVVRVDLVKQRQ